MSEESIATSATSDNSFALKLIFIYNAEIAVKFVGNCVKQGKVSFTHKDVVNFFIAYELDICSHDLNGESTLGDFCLESLCRLKC